jgi:GNAT superfamily N-acetyltransferase
MQNRDDEPAPPLTIRELEPGDVAACAAIFVEARQQAFDWANPDQFRLGDFAGATVDEDVWVAVSDGRIVGFLSVYLLSDFIHHLFVAPWAQRRGVGGALLQFALDRTGRPAALKCQAQNRRARSFYEKRGWLEIERGQDQLGEYILYRKPT